MKLYECSSIVVIIIVATAVTIGWASGQWSQEEDGPVEEAMEKIIENQIGLDVDLTPCSPEKK